MRELMVLFLLVTSAFAQPGKLGIFTNSEDIGAGPLKGSAEFDASTGQYKVTGSGGDVFLKADHFHFLWKEMTGNFVFTATTQFLTDGIDHRKAFIMLRQTPDIDSQYVDLAIHGNGMPAIQIRNVKGDVTIPFDFPIEGPGKYKLKLVRQGNVITGWFAKEGAELKERGHTEIQLRAPVLVGLGVSSHTDAAVNTVLFSDVSVEPLAPAAPAGRKQ